MSCGISQSFGLRSVPQWETVQERCGGWLITYRKLVNYKIELKRLRLPPPIPTPVRGVPIWR